MKATLLRAPVADVRISHYDEELIFDLKYFEKSNGQTFGTDETILLEPFQEINLYWSQLKEEDQLAIFNIYKQLRNALDSYYEVKDIQNAFIYGITELMKFHSFEAMKHFVHFNVTYNMPADIDEVFNPKESHIIGTRERTYVKDDYRKLIILSIALRPIGVVWGEYINRIEKGVDNVWKEYNAYYLLLNTWVLDSEPMERLDTYVTANVEAKIIDEGSGLLAPAIVAGIGIEDYPKWLLALTIMKRVVFADISGREGRSNIIQSIYGYIQSKLNNTAGSFKGRIGNKDLEADTGGEEGKLSIFESYRARSELPFGEIALIEHVLDDPISLAKQLEPQIDELLVQEALHSSRVLTNQRIMDGQVTLMQWVINNVVPARTLPYVDKHYFLNVLAVCEAVLWYRGYLSLAALLSGYPIPREGMAILSDEDAIKVPVELIDRVSNYYPYARRASHKLPKKKPNAGLIAINNLAHAFSKHEWYLTLPDNWLTQVEGVVNGRNYEIQPDLKIRLTELVIDLNERTKHELPATTDFSAAGI